MSTSSRERERERGKRDECRVQYSVVCKVQKHALSSGMHDQSVNWCALCAIWCQLLHAAHAAVVAALGDGRGGSLQQENDCRDCSSYTAAYHISIIGQQYAPLHEVVRSTPYILLVRVLVRVFIRSCMKEGT